MGTGAAEIRFWKGLDPFWHPIFVLGLPRSGKSTVFNILATAKNAEGVDEPFDVASIAQKFAGHSIESEQGMLLKDLLLSCLDNHASELSLGRSYNFRQHDKSCIFNFKSEEHVRDAHRLRRKVDILKKCETEPLRLVVALNDMEESLPLLADVSQFAQFVIVKRNVFSVARELVEKEWLSDEQLSAQINLLPGYRRTTLKSGRRLFLPPVVEDHEVSLFESGNHVERALLFGFKQDQHLTEASEALSQKVHKVAFNSFCNHPKQTFTDLFNALNLKPTDMTATNLTMLNSIEQDARKDMDWVLSKIGNRFEPYLPESS